MSEIESRSLNPKAIDLQSLPSKSEYSAVKGVSFTDTLTLLMRAEVPIWALINYLEEGEQP